jgi:hypothetical protein
MKPIAVFGIWLLTVAAVARAEEPTVVGALVDFKGTVAIRAAFRSLDGRWESLGRKGSSPAPLTKSGIPIWPVGDKSRIAPFELGPALSYSTVSSVSLYRAEGSSPSALLPSGIEVPTWDDPMKLVPVASRRASPLSSRTSTLAPEEKQLLQSAFLDSPVIASWCQSASKCDPGHVIVLRTLSFEEGIKLSELRLVEPGPRECDDALAHCAPLWLALVAGKGVRPLYQATRSGGDWGFNLTPLVVADFDGDSAVEYLFWLDAYNENGLVLAVHGFEEQVVFSYGYH